MMPPSVNSVALVLETSAPAPEGTTRGEGGMGEKGWERGGGGRISDRTKGKMV